MNKIFELDINDDFRKAILSQAVLMFFVFILSLITAIEEKNVFELSYLAELLFLGLGFNFYFKAQRNRNYAYWTISLAVFVYLLLDILRYTFIDYNILVLYIGFLSLIFLFINFYVMSSPLFFPRVQWWEYDFRYRGDLRSIVKYDEKSINSRLTDLRRNCACVEGFDFIPLESDIKVELEFDDKSYSLGGKLKTIRSIVPGRPFRYGIKFDFENDESKKCYVELLNIWKKNKQVKLRSKFTQEEA
jgi:hypothetical protein